jgi:cbb3-type cytochrome oxidase subunit 3
LLWLALTGLVALFISVELIRETADYAWLVWIGLWVACYWLWKLWDRRRAKDAEAPAPQMEVVIAAVPEHSQPGPLWRRIVRRTAVTVGGAIAVMVLMGAVMILGLGYYERQVKAERDKVQVGMAMEHVLPLVHGAFGVRAHAILPENVSDAELKHYASFSSHENTYCCFDGPGGENRRLTAQEAATVLHQKMSDGYDWIWRYTFINDTPMHFSFSVTFGADGRVKKVTDVWGWD